MIDSRSKLRGIKPSFLMRKLLIPFLAALAFPNTVNAEISNNNFSRFEKNLEAGFSLIDEVFELRSKGIYSTENEIKTKEAEKKCEEAIEIMPNNKEGYLCRGIVVGLQKIYMFGGGSTLSKQKKGIRDFTKAIKIDPEYWEAYFWRGALGFSMERLSGSSIDGRACKDIKKAYKNKFEPAINYVKEDLEFFKNDNCRAIFIK